MLKNLGFGGAEGESARVFTWAEFEKCLSIGLAVWLLIGYLIPNFENEI